MQYQTLICFLIFLKTYFNYTTNEVDIIGIICLTTIFILFIVALIKILTQVLSYACGQVFVINLIKYPPSIYIYIYIYIKAKEIVTSMTMFSNRYMGYY